MKYTDKEKFTTDAKTFLEQIGTISEVQESNKITVNIKSKFYREKNQNA